MPGHDKKRRNTPIRRFLKQLSAAFGNDCRIVPPYEAFVVANGFIVPLRVFYYSSPSRQDPDRPAIARIAVGGGAIPEAKTLRRLPASSKGTRPFPHRLELSLTPKELVRSSEWISEWIRKQAADDASISPPPFKLHPPYDEPFLSGGDDWRQASYLWSRKAQRLIHEWQSQRRADAADDKQFPTRVFDVEYPEVDTPLNPPQYTPPVWPEPWFSPNTVRFAPMFRPGRPLGKFLKGQRVDAELRAACERGYVILPQGANRSTYWRAWNDTWREYCQIPGRRRPYLSLTVGRSFGMRGRRLSLFWDWITLDPLNDFKVDELHDPRRNPWQTAAAGEAWLVVDDRLHDYYAALPADDIRALCRGAGPFGLLTPTIGRIHCWQHDDEPIRWVFDWIVSCLR